MLHGRRSAEGVLEFILVLAMALCVCAQAAEPTTRHATTEPAKRKSASTKPSALSQQLAWQIALEREGFSPGLIDGKVGAKTKIATSEFQQAHGLKVTGSLDDATEDALHVEAADAIRDYAVQNSDLDGITPLTEDWNERAKQSQMGYYSALDGLAERFHTSRALLQSLNAGVDFDNLSAGVSLHAPAVSEWGPVPKASSLRIDLGMKVIFVLDAQGNTIALFHCSIAANVEKRPSGETTVITVVKRPDYTFDPEKWPEVHNVSHKLMIPPGPRNPVGLAWIGLDLPGYGMHGTPHPEMIGKTGSHGCFRMANWDAVRLSRMIKPGAKVTFVAAER